jgi:hypothetical protein
MTLSWCSSAPLPLTNMAQISHPVGASLIVRRNALYPDPNSPRSRPAIIDCPYWYCLPKSDRRRVEVVNKDGYKFAPANPTIPLTEVQRTTL